MGHPRVFSPIFHLYLGRAGTPASPFPFVTDQFLGGGAYLPGVFHCLGELVGRESVENILLREPCSAGLQDSVVNLDEMRGVMRVGVNDDLHAMFPCLPQVNVIQIEAVGIRV